MTEGKHRSIDRFEEYRRKLGSSPRAGDELTGDIKVSGSQTLPEVHARSFLVSGSTRIQGNVSADEMKVSGSARIGGSLEARSAKISGSCHVNGDLKVEEIKISGSAKVGGGVRVSGSMRVSGSTSVGGAFEGGDLASSGLIRIGRDLKGGEIRISGGGEVGGVVRARSVRIRVGRTDLKLSGGIEADEVYVEAAPRPAVARILGTVLGMGIGGHVRTPVVRCRGKVSLERTVCDLVEGVRVSIGPGCKVGTVRYSEDVFIDPAARVETGTERIQDDGS